MIEGWKDREVNVRGVNKSGLNDKGLNEWKEVEPKQTWVTLLFVDSKRRRVWNKKTENWGII